MKKQLPSPSSARRWAVALALCALLLCLGQAALAQTVRLEALTFTLPDTLAHRDFWENDGFLYRTEDDQQKLGVGIGHCWGGERHFGLTLDWVYEQLEKGDGEYMQNLIHGQPTLFLQAVDEELQISYALAATTLNNAYVIGYERQTGTTQPIGDTLLEVLSSAENYVPPVMKGVSSITPAPTPETTPMPTAEPTATPEPTVELTVTPKPTPTPTVELTVTPKPTPTPTVEPTATPEPTEAPTPTPTGRQTRSYLGDPDDRRASEDFLFCGIDWDTDLDTALRAIEENTDRVMEYVENGSYMGVSYGIPFWGLNEEECFLPLITVVPEDGGWWVECQLTPMQGGFENTQDAVQFFQNVERALDAYKHGPAIYTLVVDDEEMDLTDPDEMIGMWEDAVLSGRESARAYVDLNNVTLSMENDMYDGTYYMTCWLMLGPSAH